jgi:hypothetical protein
VGSRYEAEVRALLDDLPSIRRATILDLLAGALEARRHLDVIGGGAAGMSTNQQPERTYTRRQVLAAGATGVVGAGALGVLAYLAEQHPGAPAASAAPASADVAATTGSSLAANASQAALVVPNVEATPSPATTQTAAGQRSVFRSRPDLTPPVITIVTAAAPSVAPGLIFYTPADGVAPDGPAIVDNAGELVWTRPDPGKVAAANFGVATYLGRPVLYWWEGTNNFGIGMGHLVIADTSYREIVRLKVGDGRSADLHEFQITPHGTALFFADAPVSVTDPSTGKVLPYPLMDIEIQEIDIATGRQLFSWHAAEHIGLDETYIAPPTAPDKAFDWVHGNSIDIDRDGNLIMSARNTCAIYKIDKASGKIMWRLGGRRSDFVMGDGTPFSWQHDARRQADGTLTLFDDGNTNSPVPAPGPSGSVAATPTPVLSPQPSDQPSQHPSRGIVLHLDETAMRATLVGEFSHPTALRATSQGNMQVLPNGNVFIGWGSTPWFTEFSPAGEVLLDATFPAAIQSYRDYRFLWRGTPTDEPAVASIPGSAGGATVYMSWNGATDVASWDVLTGDSPSSVATVLTAPKTGFETAVLLPVVQAYVAVQAKDASGNVLGTSAPTRV